MKNLLRKAPYGAAGVSMLLASVFTMQTSKAAFSGTTDNPGNSWGAGTVTLTDDDSGSAMFTVGDLAPGDGGSACIAVTYTGSLDPQNVKLYVSALADTDSGAGGTGDALRLSDDIEMTVAIYAAGQSCATATPSKTTIFSTATLGSFGSTHTNYANGVVGWDATAAGGADVTRAFEFTWALPSTVPNDAQGDGTSASFTWETQS